jgi:hypothetical protein
MQQRILIERNLNPADNRQHLRVRTIAEFRLKALALLREAEVNQRLIRTKKTVIQIHGRTELQVRQAEESKEFTGTQKWIEPFWGRPPSLPIKLKNIFHNYGN